MAGRINRGYTFGATEEVTATKLHALVDDGTVSGITADEIASGTITNDKISDISGAKFTNLPSIPLGAGVIPKENLTSVAQKGANSDITSLAAITTALSTAQGGTGKTADANTANGVVVLDASSKLPAVDGSQLTNITGTFLGSWTSKTNNTVYQAATDGLVIGSVTAAIRGTGLSDASNPPTTERASNWGTTGVVVSITFPVRKNDYWKVTDCTAVYWISLGS